MFSRLHLRMIEFEQNTGCQKKIRQFGHKWRWFSGLGRSFMFIYLFREPRGTVVGSVGVYTVAHNRHARHA
jgi:hypothetical protein